MKKVVECAVNAGKWWGICPINLAAGKRYSFAASGQWTDLDHPCGPEGYGMDSIEEWKRPFFKLVERLRPLDTKDQWFALIGKVGEDGQPFLIGTELVDWLCDRDGDLFCTANDVSFMYWNNSGAVNLTVYQLP